MHDKIIIVTGASEGIGWATARRLAQDGAAMVLAARGEEPLHQAVARIRDAGGRAEARVMDITDSEAVRAVIADVARRYGRLDGLVNNAATVSFSPIGQLSDSDWRATFAGGVDATFVATQAALAVMLPQGSGSIVNVASTNGRRAMTGMAAYSASKAAVIHFSRVAAMEAAPCGVRVNAVAPGMVMTPGNVAFFADKPEIKRNVESLIPAGRAAQPAEIAGAIRFLLSDDATFVNGVCLDVDGGKAAQMHMQY